MSAFNWTAARLDRLAKAVRAYNRAITMRERELASSGAERDIASLPPRVTVSEVKSRIHNINDFRRIVGYAGDARRGRSSELTRILKSYDPEALFLTRDSAGNIVTRYQVKEDRLNKRAIARERSRRRKAMGESAFPGDAAYDFGAMSEPEYRTAMEDNDMTLDGEGEPDDSYEDVDRQTKARWEFEDNRNKRSQVTPDAMVAVYLDTWKNPMNFHAAMPGYQDLIEAIDWMLRNNVNALNKMFDSGYDEIDPQFITESGGARNPYNGIPYETRHNRAVRFVVNWAGKAGYRG